MKISIRGLLRPWWARWIVLPLLLLLGAHAALTLGLMWRFETRLSELRAAGEPVELQDLVPPSVPEAENAASLLEEAVRLYDERLDDWPMALLTDPADWEQDYRTELQEWLAKGEAYRDLLARVAAKPALRMDLNWDAGMLMEVRSIPAMQNAIRYLEHRVLYGEGGTAESIDDIAVTLRLASKLEHPTVITTLLRWAIDSFAATWVTTLAERPDFDAAAARTALDRDFAAAIATERRLMRTALEGERTLGLHVVGRWISGESPLAITNEVNVIAFDEDERVKQPIADAVVGSWLCRPLAYGDALRLLELMAAHLDLVDLPAREAYARSESLEEEYAGQLPWLISSLYANLPEKLHRERLRHLARMRIARAGLALLELRQKRGEWPPTLEDVVPLVGADAIIDPFTGDRLAYELGVRLEAAAPVPYPDLREEYEIVWRFPR